MTSSPETKVRLQKVLASAGVASRRASEELIVQGRVKVNGKVIRELGTRIDPEVDQVQVDGRPIQLDPDRVYLAFHKPKNVVSTMSDENGRPDLSSFFLGYDRVFNVGRLDSETTGILLMTNDGDLAHALAHPSFGIEKLYVAKVRGKIDRIAIQKLLDGVKLEDGLQKADSARILDVSEQSSLIELTLHSGKNRIVRRMLEAVGFPVLDLTRKSFGPLRLGNLKPGQFRELGKLEISLWLLEHCAALFNSTLTNAVTCCSQPLNWSPRSCTRIT
jgi:pseudouridine synthase